METRTENVYICQGKKLGCYNRNMVAQIQQLKEPCSFSFTYQSQGKWSGSWALCSPESFRDAGFCYTVAPLSPKVMSLFALLTVGSLEGKQLLRGAHIQGFKAFIHIPLTRTQSWNLHLAAQSLQQDSQVSSYTLFKL